MNFADSIRSLVMPAPSSTAGMRLTYAMTLYGDSIMHQVAVALAARPVSVVKPALHSLAQPGDTAANAWRRFAYDTRSTAVVVLEPGTNDLTAGVDPVPYLERMARHALAERRTVVFTGITQRTDTTKGDWLKANAEIFQLAQQLKCAHLGWHRIPLTSTDGLHPDDTMVKKLVDSLIEAMA